MFIFSISGFGWIFLLDIQLPLLLDVRFLKRVKSNYQHQNLSWAQDNVLNYAKRRSSPAETRFTHLWGEPRPIVSYRAVFFNFFKGIKRGKLISYPWLIQGGRPLSQDLYNRFLQIRFNSAKIAPSFSTLSEVKWNLLSIKTPRLSMKQ